MVTGPPIAKHVLHLGMPSGFNFYFQAVGRTTDSMKVGAFFFNCTRPLINILSCWFSGSGIRIVAQDPLDNAPGKFQPDVDWRACHAKQSRENIFTCHGSSESKIQSQGCMTAEQSLSPVPPSPVLGRWNEAHAERSIFFVRCESIIIRNELGMQLHECCMVKTCESDHALIIGTFENHGPWRVPWHAETWTRKLPLPDSSFVIIEMGSQRVLIALFLKLKGKKEEQEILLHCLDCPLDNEQKERTEIFLQLWRETKK